MFAKKNFIFLFLFFPLIVFAQTDTLIELKSIQINSMRNETSLSGLRKENADSILKAGRNDLTIGDYLNEFSPALIKNYGPGALSSVSLRGGSSYHTAVLWKGFSITNPMNGVMDFNLLPTILFDNISIQYGGSSSIWGSGAVSGTIHLSENNSFSNSNKLKIGSRYSDASGWMHYACANYRFKKLSISAKLFRSDEKNAYKFKNKDEIKKQVHGESEGYGIILENTYLINSTTSINFNFWHQYNDRNIAPVLTEAISDALQRDKNFRYNITFLKSIGKSKIVLRNAYFNESIYYNDSALKTPSNSLCKSFISEPEYSYYLNKSNSFQIGANLTKINAIATEFKKEEEITRSSVYFSYLFKHKKLNASASTRKEFSELTNPDPVYSLGVDYKILPFINISASYSTVYRNPQVNDLYWYPGGNINLLPESGISYEGTLSVNIDKLFKHAANDSNLISFQTTAYNKDIDNWIAWTPHGILWSPSNIKSVNSYGTENTFIFIRQYGKINIRLNTYYSYTISEARSSLIAFDASVNKQLIYVPLHKAGGNISLGYKNFRLTFSHTYTGIRYTSTDNKAFLNEYNKSSVQLDKKFTLKNNSVDTFLRVDNLFDTNYQSVLNRPEPLRNFTFGISLTINQNKLNKNHEN